MKKWLYLVGGALLVAATGGLLWWLAWERPEPVYGGKPISYWIAHGIAVNPKTGTVSWPRAGSREVWNQLLSDSNAVPFLIMAMKRQDTPLGLQFQKAWCRVPPQVQKHLPTPVASADIRRNATVLLGEMGPAAVPVLTRALGADEAPAVRAQAAKVLGRLGRGNNAAVMVLTEALSDGDRSVRDTATNVLRKIDPEAARKAGVKMPPS